MFVYTLDVHQMVDINIFRNGYVFRYVSKVAIFKQNKISEMRRVCNSQLSVLIRNVIAVATGIVSW